MPQLSQPITYRTLLAFAVPMIVSQLFMNVNFIVDGFFVAHAVGTDGLSAINIVMPFIPLTIVLATMLGTGGSALVAAQLGAGKKRHARENFSLLVLVCVFLSTLIAVLGMSFLRPTLSVWDTLVCLLGFLLLLPYIFGVDGVFMATPAANFLGASVTFLLLWRKRKQYRYW